MSDERVLNEISVIGRITDLREVERKEPLPSEYPLLRRDQVLFTYLHLAANRALTEALMKSGVL